MASSEPLIASIDLWAPNFAPRNWAFCAGQLMPISQNAALFSLIGTTYGGDGRTTFALPDMRGRVPLGAGQTPRGTIYDLGEVGGREEVTLLPTQMPIHKHTATATVTPLAGTGKINRGLDPTDSYPAQLSTQQLGIYTETNNATMGASPVTITVGNAGGSQPFGIMQPYLALNYIIAIFGIFPSRN